MHRSCGYIYDYIVAERGIDSLIWEYGPNVSDGKASEVEFFDNDGDTIDVFTTPKEVIELLIEYNNNSN